MIPRARTVVFALVLAGTAVLGDASVRAAVRRLRRSWAGRIAVSGGSMRPSLEPGDWLLVDPDAYRLRPPRPGQLVLAPDPRLPERLLVKRVSLVDPDGWLRLAGDASATSTDSRAFGPVDPATIGGRPWFRYWPLGRIGPIR